MMTLVALIVTTFLMPQPTSPITMPVAAQPAVITIAPVRSPLVGSGFVATIGFAALSLAMMVRTRQRKET
jgi:hypothetical protein